MVQGLAAGTWAGVHVRHHNSKMDSRCILICIGPRWLKSFSADFWLDDKNCDFKSWVEPFQTGIFYISKLRLWKQLFSFSRLSLPPSGKWASKYLTDYLWQLSKMMVIVKPGVEFELVLYKWCSFLSWKFGHYRKRNSECFTLYNPLIVQTFLESASHHPPVHCIVVTYAQIFAQMCYIQLDSSRYPEYFSFLFSVGSYHLFWFPTNINFVNLKTISTAIEA